MQAQSLLDDYPQTPTSPFNENVFAPAFNEAYQVLWSAMFQAQIPRIELMIEWPLPPMTTEISPEDMGITDFAGPIFLRERNFGSNDKYTDIAEVDVLTQRAPTNKLIQANWRNNRWYFIGATSLIELQVKYETSGTAPTDDAAKIMVDNCGPFLWNYCVGVMGPRKGRDETAQRCMNFAVGPKYTMGTIGGQLFQLIQPLVRQRQQVQIAPKPYTVTRRYSVYRQVPYVSAMQGTTGGGSQNVPVQYSSDGGSIVGMIDGINHVFYIVVGVTSMTLYVNGLLQTAGQDYVFTSNRITFLPDHYPQPGDRITADAFPIFSGQGNYGSVPTTPIYPTVPSLFLPPGGEIVSQTPREFSSSSGGITGSIDGMNRFFTLNLPVTIQMLFRNGTLQTPGVDYTASGSDIVFKVPSTPQIGDLLTAYGF